jgi:hypothetical protein
MIRIPSTIAKSEALLGESELPPIGRMLGVACRVGEACGSGLEGGGPGLEGGEVGGRVGRGGSVGARVGRGGSVG